MKKVLVVILFFLLTRPVWANPSCSYTDPIGRCGTSTCTVKEEIKCGDCCDETNGICFKWWTCWTEIGWDEGCHGNVCRCFYRCGTGGGGRDPGGISCGVSILKGVEEINGMDLNYRINYNDKSQCAKDFSGCNTQVESVRGSKSPLCRKSPAIFGNKVFEIKKEEDGFLFYAKGYEGLSCCGGRKEEEGVNWVFCPGNCLDDGFGNYNIFKCELLGGADPFYGPQTWADLVFNFSGKKPFEISFDYLGENFGSDRILVLADGKEVGSIDDQSGHREIILPLSSRVIIRRMGYGFDEGGFFKIKNLKFSFKETGGGGCLTKGEKVKLLVETQGSAILMALKNGFGTYSGWRNFSNLSDWEVDDSGKVWAKVKNSQGITGECSTSYSPCMATPTPNLLSPTPRPGNKAPTCKISFVEPESGSKKAPVLVKFGAMVNDEDGEIVEAKWSIDGKTYWDKDMFYLEKEFLNGGSYLPVLTVKDDKGDSGICRIIYKVNNAVDLSNYWFQAQGGDIHAGGIIGSNINDEVTTDFLLEPAGVVSFGSDLGPFLNGHKISKENYKVSKYMIFNQGENIYNFSYFETNINKRRIFGSDDYSQAVVISRGYLTGPGREAISNSKAWLVNGNTFYQGGGLNKGVFLINGTLTIEKDIDDKEMPVFIVSGDIEVEGKVEKISGVFLTDGIFKTNPGKRLEVKGSVIGTGFSLMREGVDNRKASEFFSYNPWYIIKLLERVPNLGKKILRWEEVAP